MRTIFESVCRDFEAELVEFDGEDDHVHLLVNYPPKVAISTLVNSLKGVSSRWLRKKNYPSIRKKLWGNALWSPASIAGSCGGAPLTHHPTVHRTTKNTALMRYAARTAAPSALSILALQGEVLRATLIKSSPEQNCSGDGIKITRRQGLSSPRPRAQIRQYWHRPHNHQPHHIPRPFQRIDHGLNA